MTSRRIPFKVDMSGVIRILGTALYSRPDAAFRELIQNAHDAVIRRRQSELNYKGEIQIRTIPELACIEFEDDGIGLSESEAERYLGTLGIGVTGLLKGQHPSSVDRETVSSTDGLIGMFGIGLFSAFMLADRLVVESRKTDQDSAVRWEAGATEEIEISASDKSTCGTIVRLHLKPEFALFAQSEELVEKIVKHYAEFLTVPIFINQQKSRANTIVASWFESTPEPEQIELDLASYFDESPLDVIPVRLTNPISAFGALYVTPHRTPGFSDDAVVTATIRRMVISRNIDGLLPHWATFLRGVLELPDCNPTANREDLVRDRYFELAKTSLEQFLFSHFESLANEKPQKLEAIITWHRYHLAGAALLEPRLRGLLRSTYRFLTSDGQLTFDEIVAKSQADPLFEAEYDAVIWCNADRRQEASINAIFAGRAQPCVHTLRSFEESLLASMTGDVARPVDMRPALPSSSGFAKSILGMSDVEDAEPMWLEFFSKMDVRVTVASYDSAHPVMAFLNEQHEWKRTFEELSKSGSIPSGFQRLIDQHFGEYDNLKNEVVLNRNHRLVGRALQQKTSSPLASVLRLLVSNALRSAGASLTYDVQQDQSNDLDWVAECLWGKDRG